MELFLAHLTDGLNDYPKSASGRMALYMVGTCSVPVVGSFQGTGLALTRPRCTPAADHTGRAVDPPADEFTLFPQRPAAGSTPGRLANYFSVVWNFFNAISVTSSTWTGTASRRRHSRDHHLDHADELCRPTGTVPSQEATTRHAGRRRMMQNQYNNRGGVELLWNVHTVAAARHPVRRPLYQTTVTGGRGAGRRRPQPTTLTPPTGFMQPGG